MLLDADGPVALELPNQWLWNIIDEFIYQFQSFSQFRSKLSKKVRFVFAALKFVRKSEVPVILLLASCTSLHKH